MNLKNKSDEQLRRELAEMKKEDRLRKAKAKREARTAEQAARARKLYMVGELMLAAAESSPEFRAHVLELIDEKYKSAADRALWDLPPVALGQPNAEMNSVETKPSTRA